MLQSIKPPLEDMSGASKFTFSDLEKRALEREKDLFSCISEEFVVSLCMVSVFKYLYFSTIKVLLFPDMGKRTLTFFVFL